MALADLLKSEGGRLKWSHEFLQDPEPAEISVVVVPKGIFHQGHVSFLTIPAHETGVLDLESVLQELERFLIQVDSRFEEVFRPVVRRSAWERISGEFPF